MDGWSLLQTGESRAVFSGCASPVSILLTACSCFQNSTKERAETHQRPLHPESLATWEVSNGSFSIGSSVTLSCWKLQEMRQKGQRTVAQDKVLMETHSLCA